MELQLIRNATLKLNYAGRTLMVDPMFCEKGTFPPFVPGLKRNPMVDLKMPIPDIVDGVEAVLVTHAHPDHFDTVASQSFSGTTQMICAPVDEGFIRDHQFENVQAVADRAQWHDITMIRVEGRHGSGPVLRYMGEVSSFVLEAKGEPTVYIISDSVLTEKVKGALLRFRPDVVITNSGGGIIPGFEDYPVHMDEKQTLEVAGLVPGAVIVAVHLDSIDFCRTTRESLRTFADRSGMERDRLLIPEDGDRLTF